MEELAADFGDLLKCLERRRGQMASGAPLP
jgi:hypothetical protein